MPQILWVSVQNGVTSVLAYNLVLPKYFSSFFYCVVNLPYSVANGSLTNV